MSSLNVQWYFVLITFCSTIGLGTYIFTVWQSRGGGFRPAPLVFVLLAFGASLIGMVLRLGNPSRVLNILSNPRSAYSIIIITLALLIVVALFHIFTKGKSWLPIALAVTVFSIILCYGLSLHYMKFSRPALNIWAIPVYIASFSVLAGSMYSELFNPKQDTLLRIGRFNITRVLAATFMLVAILAFTWNLYTVKDMHLSFSKVVLGEYKTVYFLSLACFVLSVLTDLFRKQITAKVVSAVLLLVSGGTFFMIINITTQYFRKLV